MLHRLSAVQPPSPVTFTFRINFVQNALAKKSSKALKAFKLHKSKEKKKRKHNNSPAAAAPVQADNRRHANLGLVAFQGEIVQRTGSRAHARSGGFGLDLWRLLGHYRHFLVDDRGGGGAA